MTTTPGEPAAAPAVPYGGPVDAVDPDNGTVSAPVTAEGVARGVGRAAVSWGARALILFLLRMVFRALFRR